MRSCRQLIGRNRKDRIDSLVRHPIVSKVVEDWNLEEICSPILENKGGGPEMGRVEMVMGGGKKATGGSKESQIDL